MKVHLEKVVSVDDYIGKINSTKLDLIEWYYEGKRISIEEHELTDWKFLGLSNFCFARYLSDEVKAKSVKEEKQSKKMSLLESISNTVIGFGIALASQQIIFPMYNIFVDFQTNIFITCWFTAISIARGYIVRRFFNKV